MYFLFTGFCRKNTIFNKNQGVSKKRKVIWISAGVIGIVLLLFLANLYVKNRIEQRLESKVGASDYKDLSVNIFLNKFSVEDLKMEQGGLPVMWIK